jgi:hypothetical protein
MSILGKQLDFIQLECFYMLSEGKEVKAFGIMGSSTLAPISLVAILFFKEKVVLFFCIDFNEINFLRP